MTHITMVIFPGLSKHLCGSEGCQVCECVCVCECACVISSVWLVFVTVGCILSIQDCVVPHWSSVSATYWLVVLLHAVFFNGFGGFCCCCCCFWLWLYLLTDSTWCNMSSGNKSLVLHLWQDSVRTDISGSCGYGRARGHPETA